MTRVRSVMWLRWPFGVGGIAAATAIGRSIGIDAMTMGFVYLLLVLAVAVTGGRLFAVVMSIVSTGCYNFFFLPPLYTFMVGDPAHWLSLGTFLITSVTVSSLVVTARARAAEAETRRTEIEALYGLSVDLFTATNRTGALADAAARALSLLGAKAGGLVVFEGSWYRQRVICWSGMKEAEIEDLIAGVGRHRELLEFPSQFGRDMYVPLMIGGDAIGTLVARGTEASKEALASVGRLVGLAVERERFIQENAHLEALRESDALKTSILRAVSHDLTTPLTTIALHVEALKQDAARNPKFSESVAALEEETARLHRRIDNLLAMARLETGRTTPRPEPTPPADLFRAVRESLPNVFRSRPVKIHVDANCPDANVDPSLVVEVLVNLVENAHRASPDGQPIELVAERNPAAPGSVRIEIRDEGPGFSKAREQVVDIDDVNQRGLGLEIARSLAMANRGSVELSHRLHGGTVARVDLPAAEAAG